MTALLMGLFIFLEVVGLVVFIAPFFLKVVNAGNIIGVMLSVLLLGITLFHAPLFRLLEQCWKTTAGKIVLLVLACGIVLGVILAGYCSVRMAAAQNRLPKQPATAVVLGCKVRGTKPSLMLQRRLDAAYDYLTAYPEVMCVVSGGKGAGEDISEAEAMKRYLVQRDIAPERILLESHSVNTLQNLTFSKRILQEQHLPETVVIITDGFHQYRAHLLANRAGLNAYAKSCHTRTILIPTYWVREWLALGKLLLQIVQKKNGCV